MNFYFCICFLITLYSKCCESVRSSSNNPTNISYFKCTSGESIPGDLQCDGIEHCQDGSDESLACWSIICPAFLFRCAYGACINQNNVCNGKKDCKDNSDETQCIDQLQTAFVKDEFRCNSGQKINKFNACDGVPHCEDKSDERSEVCMKFHCPRFSHRCAYGACVNSKARCNGIADCFDGSDELSDICNLVGPSGTTLGAHLSQNKFYCNSGQVIDAYYMCDGRADCEDKSDETSLACAKIICPPFAFRCNYGACISAAGKCNGTAECLDKSDELSTLCNTFTPTTSPTVDIAKRCIVPPYPTTLQVQIIGKSKNTVKPGDSVDSQSILQIECAYLICHNGTWSYPTSKCATCSNVNTYNTVDTNCSFNLASMTYGESSTIKPSGTVSANFQCHSGESITEEKMCDGKIDCADGSDETRQCQYIQCPSFLFRCSYGACININLMCNGKMDCYDNSDEINCSTSTSPTVSPSTPVSNQFRCHSGEFIGEEKMCDGKFDCADRSDETSTCQSIQCPSFLFRCAYGACINKNLVCNGKRDCYDNSDEISCSTSTSPKVPDDKFKCGSGELVDEEMRCDGAEDCSDGSDESQSCLYIQCPSFLFRCDYGACISQHLKCNGKKDCKDNSDEMNCGLTSTHKPSTCTDSSFRCNSGQCIDSSKLCDGRANCDDASDETENNCLKKKCPNHKFRCAYGGCISLTTLCNGIKECYDGTDESPALCGPAQIQSDSIAAAFIPQTTTSGLTYRNTFQCNSKEFIDEMDLCDGIKHCEDGSDETFAVCKDLTCPHYAFRCSYGACIASAAICNGTEECADGSDESLVVCVESRFKIPEVTENGLEIDKSCFVPNNPKNGRILLKEEPTTMHIGEKVTEGTALQFNCNSKYSSIIGKSNNSICINGNWSPSIPNCKRTCPTLAIPVNYNMSCTLKGKLVSCSEPLHGTYARILCSVKYKTYTYPQVMFRICRDGVWDFPVTECVPGFGWSAVSSSVRNEVSMFVCVLVLFLHRFQGVTKFILHLVI